MMGRELPPRPTTQSGIPKGYWFMVLADKGRREGEFSWAPEAVDKLKALYIDGLSARQIADALSLEFGKVERSAVIGKINRLKLRGTRREHNKGGGNNRGKTSEPKSKSRPVTRYSGPPSRFITPPVLGVFNKDETKSDGIKLSDLGSKTCHWPLGGMQDHPPYLYCGDATVEGGVYCARHYRRSVGSPGTKT